MSGVLTRFTEPAKAAIGLAQDEARSLRHCDLRPEHLLLGLLRERNGLAARVASGLGVSADAARDQVVRITGHGLVSPAGPIPFSPSSKRALELALDEAVTFGHQYVGTEHVLLGVARVREAVAARVLGEFGLEPSTIRAEIVRLLGGPAVYGALASGG